MERLYVNNSLHVANVVSLGDVNFEGGLLEGLLFV